MTSEQFFENFAFIADAPNGVKKLRGLILQMAVQGNLVAQNPNDEPASVLLKKIKLEKERLVKEKKVRKTVPLPPISVGEISYELPQGWEWIRFGEVAQHNSGKTLDKGRNTGQFRDYITTSNLYWGFFRLANVRQMPMKDDELDKCTAKKGDLLICEGGEAGRAAVWIYDKDICFQNHVHRARFYNEINPFYGYRFFEKINATGEINSYRKGVGISNMSSKSLSSIMFPLPPLAEQHRIVAKVDQLMSLCDGLENSQQKKQKKLTRLNDAALDQLTSARELDEFTAAWQLVRDNFDLLYTTPETIAKLRQCILQLAVQGKLVTQDPADGNASELLKTILKENAKLFAEGKHKKPKFLDNSNYDDAYKKLPSNWTVSYLGNLTSLGPQNGYSPKPVEYVTPVKSLTLSATTKGVFDERQFKYIDETIPSESDLWLKNGDLLIQRGNSIEYVGIAAIYKGEDDQFIYPDLMMKIRFGHHISVDFVHLVINSHNSRMFFQSKATGTSGSMPKINQSIVNSLSIPIPPIEEQRRIIAKLDQLMTLCDTLEARLTKAQVKADRLTASTVQSLLAA